MFAGLVSHLPREGTRAWCKVTVPDSFGRQSRAHSLATPPEWPISGIHKEKRKLLRRQSSAPPPSVCTLRFLGSPSPDPSLAHCLHHLVPSDPLPLSRNHSDLLCSHGAPDLCFQTQCQAEERGQRGQEDWTKQTLCRYLPYASLFHPHTFSLAPSAQSTEV